MMAVEAAVDLDPSRMREAAGQASALLKTLGHEGRLLILCQLAHGEKSVGELAATVGMSQSALSQHLARMRSEGLVGTRREGQTIHYSLESTAVEAVIACLYQLYCRNS